MTLTRWRSLPSPRGWTVADDVRKATRDFDADLIVTGAYGYSRLREWFFGGVTRDLLAQASVCCCYIPLIPFIKRRRRDG